MTVQIVVKQEPEIEFQPVVGISQSEVAHAVDQYGALKEQLEDQMKALQPLQKQLAVLEQQLIDYADVQVDKDKSCVVQGALYEALIGKMGKQAEITDKVLLREMLGPDTFFELAKIGITDIRAYLNPKQVAKVLKEEYKTKRRIKIESKASE